MLEDARKEQTASSPLRCPVCGQPLLAHDSGADCERGHHFNRAREGYLNLLRTSKPGDATGDPKAAARSRRDFLNRGYYQPLRDALVELVSAKVEEMAGLCSGGKAISEAGEAEGVSAGTTACAAGPAGCALPLLDICCGEGYYTAALGALPGVDAYGFDLAKEMVRLASKRGAGTYFVANLKAIPVADASFALATHLFAPFNEREFARVLRPGGTLFSVVPGARHLWGLKEVLYDTPYLNDEKLPATENGATASGLRLVGRTKIEAHITLATPEDIETIFQMTPYYYRTRPQDRARLAGLATLDTPIEFVIGEYRRE